MSLFEVIYIVGGQGGNPFDINGASQGRVLEKIGVWAGNDGIRGVRVSLTNQSPITNGTATGTYKEYSFQPGERITSLSLWGDGKGTRAGRIRFYTNKSGSFDIQMSNFKNQQEYPIPVASGICTGIVGRAGLDIDSIGFIFLNPIRNARLENVRYPYLNFDTTGINAVALDSFDDTNNNPQERTWTFSGTSERIQESTWSASLGLEAHYSWTVQAGIPEVASISGTAGWRLSATVTVGQIYTRSLTLTWSESGILQQGESIHLRAVTRQGRLNGLVYEGTMRLFLHNGSEFTYPVSGIYEGVSYTGVTVDDDSWFAKVLEDADPAENLRPEDSTVQEIFKLTIAESNKSYASDSVRQNE